MHPNPSTLVALMLSCLAVVGVAVACAEHAISAPRAAEADSTYAADMLRCVDSATTLAESKSCRSHVRDAWHVDGGLDGGAK